MIPGAGHDQATGSRRATTTGLPATTIGQVRPTLGSVLRSATVPRPAQPRQIAARSVSP